MRKLPIYPDNYRMPVEGLEPLVHDDGCQRCPLYFGVDSVCMPHAGEPGGLLIVVDSPSDEADRSGKPIVGDLRREIQTQLEEVGYKGPVAFDSAIRCSLPSVLPDKKGLEKAVTECAPYMKRTLDVVKPTRIILMGPLAAWVVLGRTVDAYAARRGVAWLGDGTPVFWLPHPKRHRNRFYRDRFYHDLKWAVTVDLSTLPRPPLDEFCRVVESREDAEAAAAACRSAGGFAFDVETCGVIFDTYWRVLCTATVPIGRDVAWVWPEKALENPAVFEIYKGLFEDPSVYKVGQNVKFDCKAIAWRYKVRVLGRIEDTLLIRRALFSDARGDLATLAELVGMGGHKLELQGVLKTAKALISGTRSKIKQGKLTIERIGINAPPPEKKGKRKGSAKPPPDCPDVEVLRQACLRPEQDVDAFAYGLVAAMAPDVLYRYNALDSISTARVFSLAWDELLKVKHPGRVTTDLYEHYERLIRHLTPTLTQIESWGMPVAMDALEKTDAFLTQRLAEKLAEIHKFKPGLRPGSNEEVAAYLYDELKLPVYQPIKAKKTDGPSVEASVLQRLADKHPFVPLLLEWRQLDKLKGTYVDKFRRTIIAGRVHARLNPDGTKTGRISSSDPNLQTLPNGKKGLKAEGKMIKSMFKPAEPDWVMLQLDFSQLELRVAALLCADPKMAEIFKSGQDYHRSTARLVAPVAWGIRAEDVTEDHRSKVKEVVFGLLYGMTDAGLARRLGCTVAEAARLRAAIFGGFPLLHRWYDAMHAYAKKWGRCLTYWKGQPARRRPLFDIADPVSFENGREILTAAGSKARNASVNTPVQGSASDFMLMALIEIVAAILLNSWPARLIMSVHDSAIAECRRDFAPWLTAFMKHTMESMGWGDVPIVVDAEAGPSWGELDKMEVWLAAFFGLPKGYKLEVELGPRVRMTHPNGEKTGWHTHPGEQVGPAGFNAAVAAIVERLQTAAAA